MENQNELKMTLERREENEKTGAYGEGRG